MPELLNHDEEVLRSFCAKYPLRHFKKDRPLFYQGEVPQSAFFIKSGVIKVYNITTGGEEKIVSYEAEGSLVPSGWIFSKSPAALFYYDAFTDSQLYSIPKAELINFMNANHLAATTLLDHYASMYTAAIMHLHALEQSRARDKLLHIFQYLALRFGKPLDKNTYRVELRLTHQDIANLIGITRETVTAEISKLSKAGVIKSENLHYIVDTNKALRQVGENDFDQVNL
jgi:CRP/FNR family transcriptional regulator, cyclic AMP receptor protein